MGENLPVSVFFFFFFFRAVFVSWERIDIVSGIFFSRRVCLMGENRQCLVCFFRAVFVSWERTDIVSGIFFSCVFVSWERIDIVSGIFFSCRVCLMGENRHSVWYLFFVPCLSHWRE